MSSRTLYRLSGGTLLVGSLLAGVSAIVGAILYPGHNTTSQQLLSSTWLLVTLGMLIGSLLLVVGLPGMYLRQAGRAGVLGLVGFIVLFIGMLLEGVIFSSLQASVLPWLARTAPQLTGNSLPVGVFLILLGGGIMRIIGAIVLGIATMRAHVLPRWAGVLLLISGIGLLLDLPLPASIGDIIVEPISNIVFFLAFVWCGYTLMTQQHETVEATPLPAVEAGSSR